MFSIYANTTSFIILCVFLYGRSLRKKNNILHQKLMATAMGLDLILILVLVLGRSALSKVGSGMSINLIIHICFALSTVVLYGFALYFGLKLRRGNRSYLPKMKFIDKLVTPGRILTLVTSCLL